MVCFEIVLCVLSLIMQVTVQLSSCPAQSAGLLTVLALHLVKTTKCTGDAGLYQGICTSLRQELCS